VPPLGRWSSGQSGGRAASKGEKVNKKRAWAIALFTALSLLALPGFASASSGIFTAGSYPATITAEASGETPTLITHFGPAKCPSPALAGSLSGPKETLTALATSSSESCSFAIPKCTLAFHPVSGSTNGTFDIEGCSSFQATISTGCNVLIGAKKGLPATFENQGSGTSATIKVKANLTGLENSSTNCTPIGTVFNDASYAPTWVIRGESGGKSTGVSVKEFPGLSVIGSGSYSEFHSDFYPATISGGQVKGTVEGKELAKLELVTVAGSVKCNTATFSTPSAYPNGQVEDSRELFLSPTYKECLLAGVQPVTITPANCAAPLNLALTGGPAYVGSLFMCSTEIVNSELNCKITISSQTHSGMEYANVGSGSSSTVQAKANLSGIEYQVAGGSHCPGAPADGSYNSGKYKGVMSLKVAKVN
jgi:hypothetical protein